MPTYPPGGPTLAGDVQSISRFLKDTPEILRQLRNIIQKRFVMGKVLKGRYTTENGSILYNTGESIYADADPRPVGVGSIYPTTTIGTGQASLAATVEWGNAFEVFDQTISRLKWDPIKRGMFKLANSHIRKLDGIGMSALSSAVTQNTPTATAGGWSGSTGDLIMADVALADANLRALNEGYDPDLVLVDDLHWAYAKIAFVKSGVLPRESLTDNPAVTGNFPVIDGKLWLPTPNVPVTTNAMVLDSNMLGGWADEDFGGEGWYADPDPDVEKIAVNVIRLDLQHGYKVEARRTTVPIVQEPAAAWKVTGI